MVVAFIPGVVSAQTEMNINGQVTNNFSVTGAANMVTAMDENQPGNDATDYIWGCSVNVMEAHLEDASDPGVNTDHTVYYQLRTSSNTGGTDYDFELRQGTTIIESWTLNHTTYNTWQSLSHTISEANAANITNYNDLRIRITADRVLNSGCYLISQASLVLPIAATGYPKKVMGVGVSAVNGVDDPAKVMGK